MENEHLKSQFVIQNSTFLSVNAIDRKMYPRFQESLLFYIRKKNN